MSDPGEGPRPAGPSKPEFSSLRRRRRSGPPAGRIVGVVVLLLLLAGLGWYWFQIRSEPAPDETPPVVAEPRPDERLPYPEEELDLPPLDASDAFVRDLVAGLSAHPELARWLVPDALIERFVIVVVTVARGSSPASHLAHMEPEGEFQVREAEGRLVIDPATYRRYNLFAETFTSIDVERTARLYRGLHPLFEEAYLELGIPDVTFDEMTHQAIENLLGAPVPDTPVEVVPEEGIFEYRDPSLEELTPAAKHLLRMGPENARRVRQTLAELAVALRLNP
jgi:hypothetical protein